MHHRHGLVVKEEKLCIQRTPTKDEHMYGCATALRGMMMSN